MQSEKTLDIPSLARRRTAENMPHIYLEIGSSGTITYMNRAGLEICDYTHEDIEEGLPFEELFPKKDREWIRAELDTIYAGGVAGGNTYPVIRKDGLDFPVIFCPEPILNGSYVTGIRAMLFEADREGRLGNLYKREKQRTQEYFTLSATLLLRQDLSGTILDINKTGCEILECTEVDALGKNFIDTFIPLEDQADVRGVFSKMIDGDIEPYRQVAGHRIISKKGNIKIMNWKNRLMKTRKGKIAGVVSSGEDITARFLLEKKLRENEARYHALFNESRDGIVLVDAGDGRIVECNKEFERQTGRSSGELTVMKIWDIRPPDKIEAAKDKFSELQQIGEVDIVATEYQKPDGSRTPIEFSSRRIIINGRAMFHSSSRDITSRIETESRLRQSERRYRDLYDQMLEGVISVDPDGNFLAMNKSAERILGFTINEVSNYDDFLGRFHPIQDNGEPYTTDHFPGKEVLENGKPVSNIMMGIKQPGTNEYLWLNGSCVPKFLDGDPDPYRVFLTFTDYTENRRTIHSLQESEEKFSRAFHANPDAMAITTDTGEYLDINHAHTELFGYTYDELIGKKTGVIIWNDEVEADRIFRKIHQSGNLHAEECRVRTKSGAIHTVLFSIENISLSGRPCRISVMTDISQRKQAEQALLESEERFATAFNAIPDPIVLSDIEGNIIDVNKAFTENVGWLVEELTGQREIYRNIYPVAEQRAEVMRRLSEEGSVNNYECQMLYRDGSLHIVSFSVLPITLVDRPGFLGIAHDITEQIKAEEALRESEQRFTIAFHASPDMMVISGFENGIYYEVNDSYCNHTGYSREELIGRSVSEISLWEDENDNTRFREEMEKNGRVDMKEYRFRMKNGDIRTWLCSVALLPLRGDTRLLVAASDITERILAEEQLKRLYEQEASLRQQLEREIKRRAEFTRALVHELKTPLTPIVASSDTLIDLYDQQPMKSIAENINRGALNLNRRIDELLELARSELNILQVNRTDVDIRPVLNEVFSEMDVLVQKQGQVLELELPEELPMVNADPDRIRQVIGNLLTNAMKYSPAGSSILLRASEDRDKVIIQVQDTGPGIDKKDLARLFQPYYRKESDREHLSGLGLGLALCKIIVEQHGGKIWVESETGRGTTFSFSLAKAAREPVTDGPERKKRRRT